MSRLHKYRLWISLAALICLVPAVLLERKSIRDARYAEAHLATQIGRHLELKEQQARVLLADKRIRDTISSGKFSPQIVTLTEARNFTLLVYDANGLNYWTDNSVAIDSIDREALNLTDIVRASDGWYLCVRQKIERNEYYVLYLIKHEYPFENRYLNNSFDEEMHIQPSASISRSPDARHTLLVKGSKGTKLFYLSFQNYEFLPLHVWLLYICGALFLVLAMISWYKLLLRKKHAREAFLILSVFVLGIRYLLYQRLIMLPMYHAEWFQPDLYASSFLLPSLADFLLHLLAVTVLLLSYTSTFKVDDSLTKAKDPYWINFRGHFWISLLSQFALYTSMLFITDMSFTLVKNLVIDSHISFEITNLASLGQETYVALAAISLLFVLHFILIRILISEFYLPLPISWQAALYVLASAGFIIFQVVDGKQQVSGMLFSIIYMLLLYFGLKSYNRLNYIQKWLMSIAVVSVFSSSLINFYAVQKEHEHRMLFAPKISSQNDIDAEYLFIDIERKLETDRMLYDYFAKGDVSKRYLERRLRQLYFSGYLNKYEVTFLDYDSLGNSISGFSNLSYNYVNNVYNTQSYRNISNLFLNVKSFNPLAGYIAKLELCTPTVKYGYMFILLKPKFIQGENVYPEIFSVNQRRTEQNPYNYSFAMYKYNRLMNQGGDYAYTLVNDFYQVGLPGDFFNLNGYSHYFFADNSGGTVIVSRRSNPVMQGLTYLSFLLVFFTLLAIFYLLVWVFFTLAYMGLAYLRGDRRALAASYKYLSYYLPFFRRKGLYMSTKIQLATTTTVFAGLIIAGYVSVSYVNFKYEARQRERLLEKVKDAVNELKNENQFEKRIEDEEDRTVIINRISDSYKSDINLFSTEGKLLVTTKPKLFFTGLQAPRIHPEAMYQLETLQSSQYINTEKIGNLEFLSAYMPVLGQNNSIIAYLNLPYFSRKSELDSELSSFVLTFVNLYALFFIIVGWIAYFISRRISTPLVLIREKLSDIRLEKRNEQIAWEVNDEIGQLVKQYNRMIVELEKSVNKLAETEREGAWREMAKQVAHEIKNPLTPMKLSVQHLQRAWGDKKQNIGEILEKVTNVLIEQIDSLAALAGQFSTFAKMPVSQYEPIPLKEIVENTAVLYAQTEDVKVSCSIQAEDLLVYADRDQLMRVMNNLLKNAVQSIPEDREGEVHITLKESDGKALIIVRDNGKGIPSEEYGRIFSPNFSTKTSGMGLGLAISRKIIETAGGSISFQTELNTGTEFFVYLPVFKS